MLQKLAKMDHFWHFFMEFCPLARWNATLFVIFKHRVIRKTITSGKMNWPLGPQCFVATVSAMILRVVQFSSSGGR